MALLRGAAGLGVLRGTRASIVGALDDFDDDDADDETDDDDVDDEVDDETDDDDVGR